jgi:hypothetical protein
MMRIPFRLLMLPALACPAPAVHAQEIAYPGLEWGAPGDTVRARLAARGFRADEVLDGGDQVFQGTDGGWLRADLRGGRLIAIAVLDTAREPQVEARFRALADSLGAVLGPPDEVRLERPQGRLWVVGLTSVELEVDRIGGRAQVQTTWRGPGWYDEMGRRRGAPELPAGFTVVSETPFMRIAVDTTGSGPRGAARLRGRFRIEYPQPVTPSLNGVPQDPLDAVEYEMELDCVEQRARLIARSTFLEGRRLMSERPDSRAWSVPQPDGHYARGLDAVCRAARRP